MERRAFLALSGQTAMLAMAAGVVRAARLGSVQGPATLFTVEARVARIIEAYDAQGNHRTGTAVDRQSGEWLATQIRKIGAEPLLEPFTLNRIDVRACYVRCVRPNNVPRSLTAISLRLSMVRVGFYTYSSCPESKD